jgi:hypothetical protein
MARSVAGAQRVADGTQVLSDANDTKKMASEIGMIRSERMALA